MIISEEVYFEHDLDEISDFLEHHGIKGQKWGIRNKITKGTRAVGRGARKTGNFVKKHRKGIAIGVGSTALIAAGALVAKHILAMNATRSIKTIGTVAKTAKIENVADIVKKSTASPGGPHLFPEAAAHRKVLTSQLKPHQFIRWSESIKNYVIDNEYGYNPNTKKMGKSIASAALGRLN